MKGLLTSIITVLTFTGLQAQTVPASPKLIVGITVDQLRTDYIEAFSTLYGDKGFKRIWKEGKVFRNAQHQFANPDRSSAIAAIYTGTTPAVNGIVGNIWLDASTLRPVECVEDSEFMGYNTAEYSSAAKLLTSTITDELKIATQGKGLVYAIAPFRDAAVISAGHAADGAFWINDITGKWCSSTYYSEFPWWVSQYNDRKAVDFRITEMTWEPLLPTESYTYITAEGAKEAFKHKFDDARRNKFKRFITSPFVNDEVNQLVDECLRNSSIGVDRIPDFLSVTYYAGNFNRQSIQEYPLEIQDTYIRLDQSIAKLLDLLDAKVGLSNVLLFITSTGYTDSDSPDLKRYRVPGGDFHLNRCAALLNMYLMATYGEGQYVEAYHNQQIYLDHKLIEQKQLNLVEIQNKSADFLIQFSGVNEVYSAHRLLLGAWTPEIHKIRNSFNRKHSGDLVIDVLPGWTIVDENSTTNQVVRNTHTPMPLVFMGSHVKPEIIHEPTNVDHIAPTLAYFMRIRAPNASRATPLTDLRETSK
ncbi:alkaline phosphatase family protein [Bacteroides sp. 224]|uniref:alkaline phosphatase family protein n=1 Tax=Bacteroides sp. 224 TaxID=2302936 RepID=UPI0013D18F3E|nr:alkaline phosphatase family protein [Bacteroides sp. 224]NDV65571.1 alkaline phosphatase family protein [Bacteroides sp. 224]